MYPNPTRDYGRWDIGEMKEKKTPPVSGIMQLNGIDKDGRQLTTFPLMRPRSGAELRKKG
jgi:hypothetical protein